MTFLEALFGSQYYEILKQGKDGNKGRLNGNIILSAFIILLLFTVLVLFINVVPEFNKNITNSIRKIFGRGMSGANIGRIIALPLMAAIYFICASTAGNKKNFVNLTQKFMQYPDDVKKKANKKILLPFLLIILVFLAFALMNL